MIPVTAVSQVFEAIQQAKNGAPAFSTNFFPIEGRLQGWITHGELRVEPRAGAVFFLRKDHGFWHLYFCAADIPSLQRELTTLPSLKSERVVVDLVGREGALDSLLSVAEAAEFRRYSRLLRLTRPGQPVQSESATGDAQVGWADPTDVSAIVELLEGSFDRYADQLPMSYEIEAALALRQILAVKRGGALAALLFFETQGFTSTIRYWVVADRFRSQRLGAALMRHYFASHPAVRRFILWVTAENENAVLKYRHYGYAPDGLVDNVLVNPMIRS
jgi:ribosomal protein S18 acetylase RimI-like enzyme